MRSATDIEATPAPAAAPTRSLTILLLALSGVAFLGTSNGVTLTPFLLAMANDLGTDLGAISLLFTFSNVTWSLTALAAGPLCDKFGRKPVLLVGLALMGASCFGTAVVQDYTGLMLWRLVTGLGGGCQMTTVFASASELFPSSQRGKSLGSVMTGQSMSLVLAAPLAALIGAVSSWRWAIGSLGLASMLMLVVMLWLLPRDRGRSARAARTEASLAKLILRPRVLALFAASAMERVCYSSAVIFFATYLIAVHQVPLAVVALPLIVVALGNVGGSQLGGRLSDRLRSKTGLVAFTMTANGLLALPLYLVNGGVLVAVGLGLLYNLANGVGRPALLWLISDLSQEARGTVMGLHVTVSGIGWLIASSIGGWLIVTHGFGSLGVLAGACGFASALFALLAGRVSPAPPRSTACPGLS